MISCHGWAGGTRVFFLKNGWLKPSLEVLVFEAAVLKLRHGYSLLLSWRMLAGSATHVVGFRPRSGHLQAASCMRWQLDADYTTIGSPALVGFRCIPFFFFGMFSPLMLLACTTHKLVFVICVFRVACDFVSRLGGWDTYFFSKKTAG